MYKETVVRKKVSSIFSIIILLTISIILSDLVENMQVGDYNIGTYLTSLFTFYIILFIVNQVDKCKVKYKYSIIVDELIIYKIRGYREEVMASIKIKDIESINKISKGGMIICRISSKKYGCLNFTNDLYECKYNNGYKIDKFYFEPSYKFVDKIDVLKTKKAY